MRVCFLCTFRRVEAIKIFKSVFIPVKESTLSSSSEVK